MKSLAYGAGGGAALIGLALFGVSRRKQNASGPSAQIS
jgi:LPXTG-motif cell wall-anchored protein